MTNQMNRKEAYKLDLAFAKEHNDNPFYVDKENGIEYVFGVSSGFAYGSPNKPDQLVMDMWVELQFHHLQSTEK